MRCKAASFGGEKIEREVRDVVLSHLNGMLHDLHCTACGRQARAHALLTLAGLTVDQLMAEAGRGV